MPGKTTFPCLEVPGKSVVRKAVGSLVMRVEGEARPAPRRCDGGGRPCGDGVGSAMEIAARNGAADSATISGWTFQLLHGISVGPASPFGFGELLSRIAQTTPRCIDSDFFFGKGR